MQKKLQTDKKTNNYGGTEVACIAPGVQFRPGLRTVTVGFQKDSEMTVGFQNDRNK